MPDPQIKTEKPFSQRDPGQTLQGSYNDVDDTLTVNGFLVSVVGRRVDVTVSTVNVPNDTQNFAFSENGIALYTIQVTFTDSTYSQLLFAERIA
jgi:hypothetical protein